jgi:hypothetical protein
LNQVKGETRQPIVFTACPPVFDRDVLAFYESGIVEPAPEAVNDLRESLRQGRVKKTHSR